MYIIIIAEEVSDPRTLVLHQVQYVIQGIKRCEAEQRKQ